MTEWWNLALPVVGAMAGVVVTSMVQIRLSRRQGRHEVDMKSYDERKALYLRFPVLISEIRANRAELKSAKDALNELRAKDDVIKRHGGGDKSAELEAEYIAIGRLGPTLEQRLVEARNSGDPERIVTTSLELNQLTERIIKLRLDYRQDKLRMEVQQKKIKAHVDQMEAQNNKLIETMTQTLSLMSELSEANAVFSLHSRRDVERSAADLANVAGRDGSADEYSKALKRFRRATRADLRR